MVNVHGISKIIMKSCAFATKTLEEDIVNFNRKLYLFEKN